MIFVSFTLYGQQISLKLGANSISQNQLFTIGATITNGEFQKVPNFPNINGFQKAGISTGKQFSFGSNGRTQSVTYTQNYQPTKQGKFKLPPFKMVINGKQIASNGTTITVGAPKQQQRSNDPFADFRRMFNRQPNSGPQEYVDVKDDAFFAITPNKYEIYEGEGVTITAALYVSTANKARLSADVVPQMGEINKKLEPKHVLEEKTPIEDLNPTPIKINGKDYHRTLLFQSTYFPLTDEDIKIPSYTFKAYKELRAKNPSFFGNNVKREEVSYFSRAKTVKVNPLPAHPLKDQVAVGDFELRESLDKTTCETGNSLNYKFIIQGVGNVMAISPPIVPENDTIQVYPPNSTQRISTNGGQVYGKETYEYYLIPNEPGTIDLGDYFEWIYFNPRKKAYDTLRAQKSFTATGESKKDASIMARDLGSYYDRIDGESTEPIDLRSNNNLIWWIQGTMAAGILLLIFLAVYVRRKKEKKR